MKSLLAWWMRQSPKQRGATLMSVGTAVIVNCVGLLMTLHASDQVFSNDAARVGILGAVTMAVLALGILALGYHAGRSPGSVQERLALQLERIVGPAGLALAMPAFLVWF